MSNLSLSEVRAEIFKWRAKKVRGEKMPQELWERATQVALRTGAGKAAKEFNLDFYQLREHCQRVRVSRVQRLSEQIHVTKISSFAVGAPEVHQIEFENKNGNKLRLSESSHIVTQLVNKFFGLP